MGYRLDCESLEATLATLCTAFGGTEKDLEAFLRDLTHAETFEANWENLPGFSEFLYYQAWDTLGKPELRDSICWFHGSRVAPGTTFEEGIQPLGA